MLKLGIFKHGGRTRNILSIEVGRAAKRDIKATDGDDVLRIVREWLIASGVQLGNNGVNEMSTAYLWDRLAEEDKRFLIRLSAQVKDGQKFPVLLSDGGLSRIESLETSPNGLERAVIDAAVILARVDSSTRERGNELALTIRRNGVDVTEAAEDQERQLLRDLLANVLEAVRRLPKK